MNKKGISLLVLIITIIIIIIIAGSVILSISQSGMIGQVNEAKFKNDIDAFGSELTIYLSEKYMTSRGAFNSSEFHATIYTTPSITDVINSMSNRKNGGILYSDILEIREGKLVINNSMDNEEVIGWAKELNVDKNNIEKVESTSSVWQFDTESRTITGYLLSDISSLTEITIPNYINGIPVEKIKGVIDDSFLESNYDADDLETIIISEGIKEIGNYAFQNMYYVKNIFIPISVTTIGELAFEDCNSLLNLDIPPSVISIGQSAFDECTSLKTVVIPDSVTILGTETFYDCSSLISVTISGSVKRIENRTFYRCDNLTTVTLLEGVEYIGQRHSRIILI